MTSPLKHFPFLFMLSGFLIGDCLTSWTAFQFPWMYEGNPLMRWIYGMMGIYVGLIVIHWSSVK